MKKINILNLSIFLSIFPIVFIINNANSGKIYKSIKIAIIVAIVILSRMSRNAKNNSLQDTHGFTPADDSWPAKKDSGLFNEPKFRHQNLNVDSNKPRYDGSNYDNNNLNFEPECIENSKSDNTYNYWQELLDQSNIETESDWNDRIS